MPSPPLRFTLARVPPDGWRGKAARQEEASALTHTTNPPLLAFPGPYDHLLAGLLGGYLVFGGRSPKSGKISSVNQQIVIYVFARVALALAHLAVKPGHGLPVVSREGPSAKISHYAWPVFAATSWALVMHLFRHHPDDLQSSMRNSMNYIYKESDHWDSLRNFIWHNK